MIYNLKKDNGQSIPNMLVFLSKHVENEIIIFNLNLFTFLFLKFIMKFL
jgi:hypothetical protein